MARDGDIGPTIDSEVTRSVVSGIDDEDEGEFSRVPTIETAAGAFRIGLFASSEDALEILTEEA